MHYADKPKLRTQRGRDWKRKGGRGWKRIDTHVSRALLIRAVAYRMQENALGGLKPQTRRILMRHQEDAPVGRAIASAPAKLAPGTRLVRAWQGATHQVIVLDDGVLFRGKRHGSLSEVARIITGSRWSGPRFFGLKTGVRETGNDHP